MAAEEIKIQYFHTEKGYLAATRLFFLSSPKLLIRIAIFWLIVVMAGVMLPVVVEDFPFWVPVALALLLTAFVLYNIFGHAPTKYFRGDPKFRDKYEVTVSDEGIAIKTSQIDSKMAWSLYTRVVEGKDLFLLKYGKDLPMVTIIPKSAFKDELQEQAFRDVLKRHISHYTTFGRISSGSTNEQPYKPSSLNPPDWR